MNKFTISHRGYAITEFLASTSLIFFIAFMFIPSFVKAGSDAREDEVKANLHEIQSVLERHLVDYGEYPPFLLGGDITGWDDWHTRWDGVNNLSMSGNRTATNDRVDDYLISRGYISSYPVNPFVDDGSAIVRHTNIDGICNPGEGDPRFGYLGDVMGMGLDDPNYFKGAIHPGAFMWGDIETRRTLDHGEWMKVPSDFADRWVNIYYTFGGFEQPGTSMGEDYILKLWPGDFFYKATPDVAIPARHGWTLPIPNTNQVAGIHNRYILGCYGSGDTPGIDVIRLRGNSPDGNSVSWRSAPPFDLDAFNCGFSDFTGGFGQEGGLPEVFGGGDAWTGPWYYYNEGGRNTGDFLYGAPDGIPDGVILVLTDGNAALQEVE